MTIKNFEVEKNRSLSDDPCRTGHLDFVFTVLVKVLRRKGSVPGIK